ncbi:OrfC [Serpulina phage VSH-1]|uniref:OrfC n=1 Tax=Brachyspira hyodysenteriae (strain ATCC 49526 / WA1) TaxID=565034 RepID=A0A3B6VB33_BRAHW|nr:OrfC [Serpulina phage VSH-1] [Brachyspira hyodysenteriae WA1]
MSNILFDYANATIECQGFYEKTSYYLKRNIALDDFFDEHIKKLLNTVIRFISNKTASEISKLTHGKVYNSTKMYSRINLEDTVEWIIDKDDSVPNKLEIRDISKEEKDYIINYFLGESDVFTNSRKEKATVNS